MCQDSDCLKPIFKQNFLQSGSTNIELCDKQDSVQSVYLNVKNRRNNKTTNNSVHFPGIM